MKNFILLMLLLTGRVLADQPGSASNPGNGMMNGAQKLNEPRNLPGIDRLKGSSDDGKGNTAGVGHGISNATSKAPKKSDYHVHLKESVVLTKTKVKKVRTRPGGNPGRPVTTGGGNPAGGPSAIKNNSAALPVTVLDLRNSKDGPVTGSNWNPHNQPTPPKVKPVTTFDGIHPNNSND